MDPPPLSSSAAVVSAASAAATQLVYTDSLDSASPRSRAAAAAADSEEAPLGLAQVPGGAKLRLMCSYGGHIIPRPHDKSLCYVGGETRIVVAERHSSLSDLTSRLSKTLLNGRPFTLKYQLPNEDLDSLISVTSDEDLENLVEEYDRVSATTNVSSSGKASNLRLRLFLFFSKPETAASMGALLDDAKSESWFVDALNGSGLLPRNFSDSAAGLDCLLTGGSGDSAANQADFFGGGEIEKNGNAVSAGAVTSLQEVHSVPESAFVESNTSSSGSGSSTSTSSPCLANLPPIRVRVGIEDQFAQMGFPPAPPAPAVTSALPPNPTMAVNSGETTISTMNRINSDDEIAAQKFRKPPLPTPLQPQLFNKHGGGGGGCGGGYSLTSPDSVTSDSSIASGNSVSKPMYYQDQVQVASREGGGGRAPVSPNTASDGGASDQGSRNQVQQVQDSGYGLPSMPAQSDQQQQLQQQHQQQQLQLQQQQQQQQQQLQQQQQQQLVHAAQYMSMHHQVPMSPYYAMYAPPPQQHHQIDPQQQYPVYLMPVAPQSQQAYKMALQSNMPDPNGVAAPVSSRIATQSPGNAYTDNIPPLYPPKTVSPAMPEMTTQSVYQTSVTPPAPQLVQIPSNQYQQQQYMGYTTQMHHPSQSIAVPPPSATAPNYSYEYPNEQAFYPQQHQPTTLPPHYQSMTPAAAAAAVALSEESKQLAAAAAAYSAADQSHTQA